MSLNELIETYGFYLGITALISWMVYIMVQLARESKAGKMGTVVIFLVLGLGIMGFVIKGVIQWVISGEIES